MKKSTWLLIAAAFLVFLAGPAWAESANQQEAMAKCREASLLIRDNGIETAIHAIGNKQGPFVWKDSYVFLMNMDGKMLAHPMQPELTQEETLVNVTDIAGKPLFLEFIELANSKGKGWVDYMGSKPGQGTPVAKTTFVYRVPGTQYIVAAGIYK